MNNKIHVVTKILPFMTNYERELRIGTDIRRKSNVKKVTKFAKRIKKVQKKAEAVIRKIQEKMKRQADKGQREVKE